jgi:predicted RNA-binding Zn-ribbon protein involved in translation (DUF1610 family)
MPFSTTHASSRAILRSPCPKCGTTTILARVEPDAPGSEKRTFECPNCRHYVSEVVKF